MEAHISSTPPATQELTIAQRLRKSEASTVPAPPRQTVYLGTWDGVAWHCSRRDDETEQEWKDRAAESLCALLQTKFTHRRDQA